MAACCCSLASGGGRRKHECHDTEYIHTGPPKEPKCAPVLCASLHLSILGFLPEDRASVAGALQKKLLLSSGWP